MYRDYCEAKFRIIYVPSPVLSRAIHLGVDPSKTRGISGKNHDGNTR
jgi:hypothetical protein